jgi:hypothetical protein
VEEQICDVGEGNPGTMPGDMNAVADQRCFLKVCFVEVGVEVNVDITESSTCLNNWKAESI